MGLNEIKVEEVETLSEGRPSIPHADSPNDSQCAESSIGDAQMSPAADPYDPLYTQISTAYAKNKR